MSWAIQYTTMSPSPSSSASQQSSRLNQRRNAMANVMDGVSTNDINTIKDHALSHVHTVGLARVLTSDSAGRRQTPTSNLPDDLNLSAASGDSPEIGFSAIAAYHSPSSSPLQSPGLKNRRNALADALADIDQGTLSRIRAAYKVSSHHNSEHEHDFEF